MSRSFYSLFFAGCLVGISPFAWASDLVHLFGLVEQSCPKEPSCIELRVDQAYVPDVGERVSVRLEASTTFYDPENYAVNFEQSNMVVGSYLRLLLARDPKGDNRNYRAITIWMGD